jgi:dolichol-phosphate mannosyltransferase
MKQLAVVVPVLNERDNIAPMVEALSHALEGLDWEVLFVDDDSTDGTSEAVAEIACRDPRVRLIERIGRRGLASASVEGMLATTTAAIAVIDGDMQHDETLLPVMWKKLKEERLDLVVASRNIEGGAMGDFAADRVRLSNAGKMLASLITPRSLAPNGLSDPMSGFFMVDRDYLLEVVRDLSQIGFKILLDLVASSPRSVRIAEVPYRFRMRRRGESKLDAGVEADFLLLVGDKLIGRWIPARYVLYAFVGLIGVVVHLTVLAGLLYAFPLPSSFAALQSIATACAIISNFFINNAITYSDRRIRGAGKLLLGLIIYSAGCSVGAAANIGLASLLAELRTPPLLAGFAGMVVSSVWNFAIANVFTWRLSRRRAEARRK